ncbi:MAG: plastocyanin/azurin family copper-binding protein [Nitrososphaeraceae archaeon]
MNPVYSKVVFGIGVILSISAVISIYVTTIAVNNQEIFKQNNPSSSSSSSAQSKSSLATQQNDGQTITVDIPQGAGNQLASLDNKYYNPNTANVTMGMTVTWVNKDFAPHTATSGKDSSDPNSGSIFDTGDIQPGSSKSITISQKGEIPYYCTIHPWMVGSSLSIS